MTPAPVIIAGDVSVGDCDHAPVTAPSRIHRLRQAEVEHLDRRRPPRTLILAGFRSRWMMPCSCAASSASAICFAIGSASSRGNGPRAIRSASVGPRRAPSRARDAARIFQAVDVRNVGMVQRGENCASR